MADWLKSRIHHGDIGVHRIILGDTSAAAICFNLCLSRQLLEQVIGCIRKVQWADATGLNEGTLKYSHCSEEENGHTDAVLNSTRCGAEEDVGE